MSTAVAVPPSGTETSNGVIEKIKSPGVMVPDRLTGPVKLLRLVNVMVDVLEEPGTRDSVLGFRDRSKSGPATTVTVAVCVIAPLVPVTFTR